MPALGTKFALLGVFLSEFLATSSELLSYPLFSPIFGLISAADVSLKCGTQVIFVKYLVVLWF